MANAYDRLQVPGTWASTAEMGTHLIGPIAPLSEIWISPVRTNSGMRGLVTFRLFAAWDAHEILHLLLLVLKEEVAGEL